MEVKPNMKRSREEVESDSEGRTYCDDVIMM